MGITKINFNYLQIVPFIFHGGNLACVGVKPQEKKNSSSDYTNEENRANENLELSN